MYRYMKLHTRVKHVSRNLSTKHIQETNAIFTKHSKTQTKAIFTKHSMTQTNDIFTLYNTDTQQGN